MAEEIETRLRRSLADEQGRVLPEPVIFRLDALDHAFKVLLIEVATLVRDCWPGDDQSLLELLKQKSEQRNTPPKA